MWSNFIDYKAYLWAFIEGFIKFFLIKNDSKMHFPGSECQLCKKEAVYKLSSNQKSIISFIACKPHKLIQHIFSRVFFLILYSDKFISLYCPFVYVLAGLTEQ